MSNYRRAKIPGGYYFFTLVTYKRHPIFNNGHARACLRQVWKDVQHRWPFTVVALCLLPEHLHCIWKLPEGDDNYSIRWSLIKRRIVQQYRRVDSSAVHADTIHPVLTPSGIKRNESSLWQRRFWEHYLKDGRDIQRHIAYIHYNPVKHGLVEKQDDWPWSTYKSYVESNEFAAVDYVDLQNEMTAAIEGE